jgi:hypothetical protein
MTNRLNLSSNLFEYPYTSPCFKLWIGAACVLKCIASILSLVYFVKFTSIVIILDLLISVGLSSSISWIYHKVDHIGLMETYDIRQTYYIWLRRLLCMWSIIEFIVFITILIGSIYVGVGHYADPPVVMSIILSVIWFTFLYIILSHTWSTYENIGEP